MKLRVMLADDHAVYRDALCCFLETQADIEVVAQAADGYEVLGTVDAIRPDVVCMDIGMRGLDGIETTRQLLGRRPDVKVVALSAHVDLSRVAEMVSSGALGYVIKGSAGAELLAAIRRVSLNQNYFDPALGIKDVADLEPYLSQMTTAGARRNLASR